MELILDCGDYSLNSSLAPSFISSLYESLGSGAWVKVAGKLGGRLRLEQRGRRLIIISTAEISRAELEHIAILETGLWHEEFERGIGRLPAGFREAAEALAETYPGVRIPIAPWDFEHILMAVLLSKRASYEIVRRWCRRLWEMFQGDLRMLASAKPTALRRITRSYQLLDAVRSMRDLMRIVEEPRRIREEIIERFGAPREPLSSYILCMPPEAARVILLSAWGIGPKVADSTILSTFKAPHFIPCDVHLRKFITRLSLAEDFKMPEKSLCKRFLCNSEPALGLDPCPSRRCLRAILRPLGELGGWMQTLIYLHGKECCRSMKPRCDKCSLRRLCASSTSFQD
ncbi:MAG: hypothetical protein L2C94_005840 [Aigarchaeota archaeon]|nr:hypothetical protein [Candidatus Wolframiiraptor gerlachensis]